MVVVCVFCMFVCCLSSWSRESHRDSTLDNTPDTLCVHALRLHEERSARPVRDGTVAH
jgi:hypothetical protein